jgi:uncharacterized protein
VRENGLLLAARTGARVDVVELFAYFHDACRHDDGYDAGHGPRGALLARQLHGQVFDIDAAGIDLLAAACDGHTGGGTVAEITVATCWDADRLDLGRVGTTPRPERLCTDAARDPEVLAWGYARSLGRAHPRPGQR